ncbi:DUF2971 domain-containing protein [Clostridium sp. ZS2-4]|uniref:DUF2971 domain-containing protein n=1 Tax=Clostridium sp. ZS2-4 TaxID=2987703 RepID=UPI00227B48A4|nr:DUF2971 domain-containing protein [Clostridium sp. ZS2-4]MCY6355352.1 DUF2971 domain-containing protein [Clostridium sp. ZS2-4]
MLNNREWRERFFNQVYAWTNYNPKMHYNLKVEINRRKILNLYKYRSGSKRDINNLKDNKLSAVKFYMFNDPFEFHNNVDPKIAVETYSMLMGEDYSSILNDVENNTLPKEHDFWTFYNSTLETVIDFKRNYNVCCLSEEKDSLLMWSHYANEHKGFCIEYRTTELFDKYPLLCPALYTDTMPSFGNGENEIVNLSKVLFTKSLQWEYENEWRITFDSVSDVEMLQTTKPTAIYVGCRIESNLFGEIFEYCKDNKVRLFKSKMNPFKYKLDFEEIIIS